ncbi:hypothetical protein E4Z66_05145 [Aliishimia ponticola]|uniref:D-galactarate dehydratase n=1 Tax=Aliishimia ponticola TaxID=2499833 RepID=A0A4S4NGZ6_9RHOB|nr:hypothetical protein [Aliishimia ponticola]THH38944.1 hypothetical protein E4Z66_05145 [Aliishimia ponticola]
MKFAIAAMCLSVLGGCALTQSILPGGTEPAPEAAASAQDAAPETPTPATTPVPVPVEGAQTVDQFDTTTKEEKAAAQSVPEPATEASLGRTVASLGSPSEAGFWLKTPLVKTEQRGRVVYPANGRSVQVTLIPIEGEATAGSRLSLSAFRVIEAPLTGLPEVEVFATSAKG